MWDRTKRLINSYLEEMIEKVSSPGREVYQVTRAEVARLNELEVQARASAKMLEKELAEVELKIVGIAERERMARERADEAAAGAAGRELMSLAARRDLLKQQIGEAQGAAARARALREERGRAGADLANETYLTSMRDNLAGIQTPFGADDPAATIEEMRSKLGRHLPNQTESRISEVERELEAEQARSRVDGLLARYKEGITSEPSAPPPPTSAAPPANPAADEKKPEEPKTLGRTEGPIRPID